MPTPAQLRKACRSAIRAAKKESDPHLKRMMANHAFALAQLAEKIEREAGMAWALASQTASSRAQSRSSSLVARAVSAGTRRLSVTVTALANLVRTNE
jgi:hypothetical protein